MILLVMKLFPQPFFVYLVKKVENVLEKMFIIHFIDYLILNVSLFH